MKSRHIHRANPKRAETIPFWGPINAAEQNEAAHGNITAIDYCRCGATKRTNINGRHLERGKWEVELPW